MDHNYLNQIGEVERDRLSMQHEAWKPETLEMLKRAGAERAKNIVEFGCGPGLAVLDVAGEIAPQANITAVDVSEYYLNHLRGQLQTLGLDRVRVMQQDATQAMELAPPMDLAYCRWFLAWVTDHLDTVLASIFSSLRPGGRFAAMEYLTLRSTAYSPACPALSHYLQAWETFYQQAGGSTDIGQLLAGRLVEAGFEIEEVKSIGGLAARGHRWFDWWERLDRDFRSTFLEKQLLTDDDARQLDQYWNATWNSLSAFLHTPLMVQIVAKKPF